MTDCAQCQKEKQTSSPAAAAAAVAAAAAAAGESSGGVGRKRTRSNSSADDLLCDNSPPPPRHPPKRRLAIVPRSKEHTCAIAIGVEMVLDSITLGGNTTATVVATNEVPTMAPAVTDADAMASEGGHTCDNEEICDDIVHDKPAVNGGDDDDDDSDSDD